MKWFKHLTGSLNDSFIFELIEKFGGDGYLVFFGTLELMSDEFDIFNPGHNRFLVKKLTKNFQLSRQKTVKIWKFCDEKAKETPQKHIGFYASINENYIDLFCPRLKELTDEYTAKQLKKMSGQTPDQVSIESGQIPEQEAEADREEEKDIQFFFPLRNGKMFELGSKKVVEYEKTYSRLSVREELRKCVQWNVDNPGKRKTEAGILKHINWWLSNTQGDLPKLDAGIQGDGSVVDEMRREAEEYDPIAARDRVRDMALRVGKGIDE